MAEFSNAQKLAAVVSAWARPAISQIASEKIGKLGFMQSLQSSIVGFGLVDSSYDLVNDIKPIMMPVIDAIIEPLLTQQFSKMPDAFIPQMARNVIAGMKNNGNVSLLNGLIVLETADFDELNALLDANLPLENYETYKVKTNDEQ